MAVIKAAKVTMWLADYAQVADGKLNVIGGGWSVIGPQPQGYFIALLIEMPWNAAGIQHTAKLELIDDQGHAVIVESPEGDEVPMTIIGQFGMAPALGIKNGTPLVMPLAIPVPLIPIPAGGRYEWRLEINGQSHEDWRIGFSTRPEAQSNVG